MRIVVRSLLIVLVVLWAGLGRAELGSQTVDVYFFFSTNCPHCHHQMGLMQAIAANNPDVVIHYHEISQSSQLFRKFLTDRAITYGGVPRTFVGETSFIGYAETGVALVYSNELQGYLGNRVQIVKALEKELGHPLSLGSYGALSEPGTTGGIVYWWPLLLPLLFSLSYLPLRSHLNTAERKRLWFGGFSLTVVVALFLLLAIIPETMVQERAGQLPFPLFVFTIALADGFNPCAFTVLIILLSLLTYTRRRSDMLLFGGVFILTSAIMYFLFIMALVMIGGFFIERYGRATVFLLGLLISGAGLLNIKDYFFLGRGFSLGLSENQKVLVTKKAAAIVRRLNQPGRGLWLGIGAIIMLGIMVNLVELGCTAILPAVYLTSLVSRYDSLIAYGTWTAWYALVYVVPLLCILLNFVYFFSSVRLTEEQGRLLKLLTGMVLLVFGLLMILRPSVLTVG